VNKKARRLTLHQPSSYRLTVVGHLNPQKAAWFEGLNLSNEYDEDGTPITVVSGEVLDQAMLHGLLSIIRDLGLPLADVHRFIEDEAKDESPKDVL